MLHNIIDTIAKTHSIQNSTNSYSFLLTLTTSSSHCIRDMFDGKIHGRKVSANSGIKRDVSTKDLVEASRRLREQRLLDRAKRDAALKIQSIVRSVSARKTLRQYLAADFLAKSNDISKIKSLFALRGASFAVPLESLLKIMRTHVFCNSYDKGSQLPFLASLLHESVSNSSLSYNVLSFSNYTEKGQFWLTIRILCELIDYASSHAIDENFNCTLISSIVLLSVNESLLDAAWTDRVVHNIFTTACKAAHSCLIILISITQQRGRNQEEAVIAFAEVLVARVIVRGVTRALESTISGSDRDNESIWLALGLHLLSLPISAPQCRSIMQPLLSVLSAGTGAGWRSVLRALFPFTVSATADLLSGPSELSLLSLASNTRWGPVGSGDIDDESITVLRTKVLNEFCRAVVLTDYGVGGKSSGQFSSIGEELVLLREVAGSTAATEEDTAERIVTTWKGARYPSVLSVLLNTLSMLPLSSYLWSMDCGFGHVKPTSTSSQVDVDCLDEGIKSIEEIVCERQNEMRIWEARRFPSSDDTDTTTRIAMEIDEPTGSNSMQDGSSGNVEETLLSIVSVVSETTKTVTALLHSLRSSSIAPSDLSLVMDIALGYSAILIHAPVQTNVPATSTVSSSSPPTSSDRSKKSTRPVASLRRDVAILNSLAFMRRRGDREREGDTVIDKLWTLLSRYGEDLLLDMLLFSDSMQEFRSNEASAASSRPHSNQQQQQQQFLQPPKPTLRVLEEAARVAMSPTTLCFGVGAVFYLFSRVLLHRLSATDDEEFFHEERAPLSLDAVKSVLALLKQWLYRLFYTHPVNLKSSSSRLNYNSSSSNSGSNSANGLNSNLTLHGEIHRLQLFMVSTKLFNALHARNERRRFMDKDLWQWKGVHTLSNEFPRYESGDLVPQGENGETGSSASVMASGVLFSSPQIKTVLALIPQVIPFDQRLRVFQTLLRLDNNATASSFARHHPMGNRLAINVRREHIMQDAYAALAHVDESMLKGKIRVEFQDEAGIDGGGLFKAFMDAFLKAAFDPVYGLFIPTEAQLLVPNPGSRLVTEDHLKYFNFFGKMLGVAIYNNILVEPQFSGVFLNVLLGRLNEIDDLWYIDPTVHRSLMRLKHMALSAPPSASNQQEGYQSGDPVAELGLVFEASRSGLGAAEGATEELVPGGSTLPVTKENVHSYIHRFAHYKLNVEAAPQCRAFLAGFRTLVPGAWMHMFSPREMQLLISGDQTKGLDIADMRRHVVYHSGYYNDHPYIDAFWGVVSGFDPQQQADLLRFVTSCSRPPLLGFSHLHPRFGIQRVSPDMHGEAQPITSNMFSPLPSINRGSSAVSASSATDAAARLPSAATCMNLLKLPHYNSIEVLREKLLYAITSNAGFELS